MTLCDFCGAKCDKSLGCYRELKTEYWGGATGKKITYSPKDVRFFCSDEHRSLFLYGFDSEPTPSQIAAKALLEEMEQEDSGLLSTRPHPPI